MKCLSIQQPWTSLIAIGIIDVENRTSEMQNKLRMGYEDSILERQL